jgi:hypothetical protein
MLDVSLLTPPQRRVYEELFAVGAPRPPADDALARDARALLFARTAPVAALRRRGTPGLVLNKTALDALGCDGRYRDLRDAGFAWSPATVLGTLVHRGVELDHAGRRRAAASDVVAHAWRDFAAKGESAGRYLTTLRGVEADALRGEAAARIIEFRDCFPLVPATWNVRFELRLRVPLHRGALELRGTPDLVLGTGHPAQRRMLLIDFKTGQRSAKDRADVRFYALLSTLKYATAPFRVATYYLDEAEWDAEDVDAGTLEATVRLIADRALRAAELEWAPPPETALRLVAGVACRWCARAPACPARLAADAGYVAGKAA